MSKQQNGQRLADAEIQAALAKLCNKGPYVLNFGKSVGSIQVYRCQECGAEIRVNVTLTHPTWLHYKPGYEAKTDE